MNRIPGFFGVAALIFTLGIFSGNMITLPTRTPAQMAESPQTDSSTQAPASELASLPDNWAMDSEPTTFDSFAEFAESNSRTTHSSILLASASAPSDAADSQEIRQAIVEEFPDLDAATVDGWVAGYSGMSLETLKPLLQQKKMLPSILPSTAFADFGTTQAKQQSAGEQPINIKDTFRQACKKNLNNAFTIGYRRQTQIVRLAEITTNASTKLEPLSSFDFTPGQLQPSNSVLHLAIEENPNLFFQLTPGNILTRSGAFSRLGDGNIGVMNGDTPLVLAGTTNLPYEASNIKVSADGTITYDDVESESKSAGKIVLVEVKDLSRLSSSNGVYFVADEATSDLLTAATDAACLVSGALESSNADPDNEWKHLQHFQRLSETLP